jgi:hypothetical protein
MTRQPLALTLLAALLVCGQTVSAQFQEIPPIITALERLRILIPLPFPIEPRLPFEFPLPLPPRPRRPPIPSDGPLPLPLPGPAPAPVDDGKSHFVPAHCGVVDPKANPALMDCWLNANIHIREGIRFDFANSSGQSFYKYWPQDRQQMLREAFTRAWVWLDTDLQNWNGPVMTDPLVNQQGPGMSTGTYDWVRTVVDQDAQAFPLFIEYVAQTLALEIRAELPWSIRGYSLESIWSLLAGHDMFRPDSNSGDAHDLPYAGAGLQFRREITLGQPFLMWRFLKKENLVGATARETVERALEWSRLNLSHYVDNYSWKNLEYHWDYLGHPPMSRILSGTEMTDPAYANDHDMQGIHHWIAGCHGTTDFLDGVLRVANIPVLIKREPVETCYHTLPWFPTLGLYLSHGDDPYSSLSKGDPMGPIGMLLIDEATYATWFKTSASASCTNVGRRPADMALQYPGRSLVFDKCMDDYNNVAFEDGRVYANFKSWYTVQQVKDSGVLEKIDALIQAKGCFAAP